MTKKIEIVEDLREMYDSLPVEHPARPLIERLSRAEQRVQELEQENDTLKDKNARLQAPVSAYEWSISCDKDASGRFLATPGTFIFDRIIAARAAQKREA